MNIRLPQIDSAAFKGIIVFVYTNIPTVIIFLTDPNILAYINEHFPGAIPLITLLPSLLALFVGLKRSDVPNY